MPDVGAEPTTAVIVMAYGSPERPEDIPAYFADIRGGRPVSQDRVEELAERYRRIGGTSPLNEITERQRAGLEAELGLPVYTGMKHWQPRIADAAEAARDGGATRLVGIVLAPHYSRLSVGGYRDRLEASLNGNVELRFVENWHDHEPFVSLVADRVFAKLDEHGWRGDGHVVFTAHSLPQRILSEGDPYREKLLETARLAAARDGLPGGRWSFAFQSESQTGEPWLGPDILEHLDHLHADGVRRVLVAPVGFVADHLEILWDLDVEARQRAGELGIELDRIVSLNDDPAFIRALADLVRKELV
jgi:protoporphyrin/coproporphyrin ferrochelatase